MKIAVLADVPVWLLPGMSELTEKRHYATWLEALIPHFGGNNDFEIHWVCISRILRKKLVVTKYGQTFHILPRRKKMISMLTAYLLERGKVKRLIKLLQPDLVHAWGSEDVYGLAGGDIKTKNKLFTLQGCLNDYLQKLGGSKLFRIQAHYERQLVKNYRLATAESPLAKEQLLMLNNNIDCSIVDYPVRKAFHDAQWDPSIEPVFIYAGAITKRKGVDTLVDLFSSPEYGDVKLRMIGGGDLQEQLMAKSTGNIEWLGSLSPEEVCREMEKAWCLLMPTLADTGPTVVKEARVVGTPVCTTPEAGASDYLECFGGGRILPTKDLASWKAVVRELSRSREFILQLGRENHADLKKELHPATTARKFRERYLEIISKEDN